MMTRLAIVLLCCLLPVSMLAQDTTGVHGVQPVVTKTILPTAQDIADSLILIRMGQRDPFVMLPALVRYGDPLVPALAEVLWSDSLFGTVGTQKHSKPNQIYVSMMLEAIGTRLAYDELVRIALTHRSTDIRGLALNALATSFHSGKCLERFTPDKELVHLFLRNVDDTTQVKHLNRSFGQIAREGMITWTGRDPGQPQGSQKSISVGVKSAPITLSLYREQNWLRTASKITWNDRLQRFVLP